MRNSAVITDPEEIRRYVREAVVEAVRKELPDLVREATQKPYLSRDEVMDLTGWSERTLQNLRDTRQISFVQHRRKIVYPTVEIYRFLDAHKVKRRNR